MRLLASMRRAQLPVLVFVGCFLAAVFCTPAGAQTGALVPAATTGGMPVASPPAVAPAPTVVQAVPVCPPVVVVQAPPVLVPVAAPACLPTGVPEQKPFIALYGWIPAMSADLRVDGFERSVSASISDVLHHFKGGGAAHYESGGRTNIVLDVLYAKLEKDIDRPFTTIEAGVKQWLVEGAVTFGRTGNSQHFFEGLVGGRYFSLDNSLVLRPQDVGASKTKSWAEPMVGARYGATLSPPWSLLLTGDVGGFGVGSHLTWEGVATFRYRLSGKTGLGIGYRYMHIDYDKDGFEFTGSLHGPLIGFGWEL